MEKSTKIDYLESLRGIAAISVAIYHFNVGSIFNNGFTYNAWLMVEFFFCLSGYVIGRAYLDRISDWSELRIFIIRRFFRLYPLHLLLLLIYLILEIVKFYVEMEYGLVANTPAFTSNNEKTFLLNLFLVHNLINADLSWNGVSWSISAEFYTYLIFALLVVLSQKSLLLKFSFVTLLSLWGLTTLLANSMETEFGFFRCLYAFFLGVVVQAIARNSKQRLKLSDAYVWTLAFIAVFGVIVSGRETELGINLILPVIFVVFLFALEHSRPGHPVITLLSMRPLVFLGTVSYGIYMFHMLVWWVYIQVLRFRFGVTPELDDASRLVFPIEGFFLPEVLIVSGLMITILLSSICYRFLEKPCMEWGNKYSKK